MFGIFDIFNNITTSNGNAIAPRDTFMNALQTWEANFAFDTYYLVTFDIPPIVSDKTYKDYGEKRSSDGKEAIDFARKRLQNNPAYTKNAGCIFCTGISLPQESVRYQYNNSINNRGFIGSPMIESRDQFLPLSMEIYENNLSFGDFLLRPWSVITSHRGLAAPKNDSKRVTSTMQIVELAKGGFSPGLLGFGSGPGLMHRKTTTVFNCAPVQVSPRTLVQQDTGGISRSNVSWVYSHYEQTTSPEAIKKAEKDRDRNDLGLLGRILGL